MSSFVENSRRSRPARQLSTGCEQVINKFSTGGGAGAEEENIPIRRRGDDLFFSCRLQFRPD
ncbi:hypothetical protein [Candidatus Electronema sp. JC]|uniref:hypothetical protein n=1 Tax=Candidatus Electronema sp. JC TaxID=3401570 RepID=UPI003B4315F2